MSFENLTVSRIIIHEIFKRRPGNLVTNPVLATAQAAMAADAMEVFRNRVMDALGSDSQSMLMDILPPVGDCAVRQVRRLNDIAASAEFVTASAWFPNKLAQVQTSQQYPGGIVVVFDGTVGAVPRKFVGIIKAEMSSGFRPTDNMQIDYIRKLFLGEGAKLYKIGIFVRPLNDPPEANDFPAGWEATIYDKNILADRGAAARYFYGDFLGCRIPPDAASLTKQFYGLTSKFIKRALLDEEQKNDIIQALHTYLKAGQAPTVQVGTFAEQYIPLELRHPYTEYMEVENFPNIAVAKDISEISDKLAKRRLKFGRGVTLSGSMEAFDDYVKVEQIPADGVDNHDDLSWTKITVKDRIRTLE